MKRFKAKKNNKHFRIFFCFFLGVVSFSISLSFLSSLFHKDFILDFLLNTTIYTEKTFSKENGVLDFLLDYTIGKKKWEDEIYDGSKSTQEYINDPSPEENKKNPLVYIYNSHQGEEYFDNKTNNYQVTPTVMLAAYKLREELNKRGIPSIVETTPMKEILDKNNWNYASSYKASRILMEEAKKNNPSLEYFFDLHRDSLSYENSILKQDDKVYAKLLFVIGTDHENYQENLQWNQTLEQILEQKLPGLSRGIIEKGGSGVNGIYNQDFSSHTLLFEIGGEYNRMSEVTETILLLADALQELIEG